MKTFNKDNWFGCDSCKWTDPETLVCGNGDSWLCGENIHKTTTCIHHETEPKEKCKEYNGTKLVHSHYFEDGERAYRTCTNCH